MLDQKDSSIILYIASHYRNPYSKDKMSKIHVYLNKDYENLHPSTASYIIVTSAHL